MSDEKAMSAEEMQEMIEAKAAELAEAKIEEATTGLAAKNRELLGEVKTARARMRKYADIPEDFDPEELESLRSLKAQIEEDKAKAEGNWTKLREDLVNKHTEALRQAEAERESAIQQLDRYRIDDALTQAVRKAKGTPELLMPHLRNRVRLDKSGDKARIEVLGPDGEPTIGSADGSLMTVDQLVAEFRASDIFARCFEGTGAAGSGANGSGNGSSGAIRNPWKADTLNLTEQARLNREEPELAARLKSEASH